MYAGVCNPWNDTLYVAAASNPYFGPTAIAEEVLLVDWLRRWS